ncbi:regulator of chromosome condensation domain-containing protein [Cavenderia fasciculata]|uniref:Regulator of chromosome condensation domain-containing protein n=1 Tax=Cavenderia fasciculata TaxID=261658 RepID=F4PQX9_CACFS|nr:regulator of chromosome condensation domain-containing protein [Cavenderia fasciculata]EGG21244.1 regulator of chromosome condensation domain-containing protein [Cavenderia fasciculata]|eukprot:XP_004359094.1 regulator of chromosome condensation domain-containing protein [Cavenderia fasciculata]
MYSWGSGRIGHGPLTNNLTPTLLNFNNTKQQQDDSSSSSGNGLKFISISAGKSHSLLIDETNRVWFFGDCSVGQNGDSTERTATSVNYIPFPVIVKELDQIYTRKKFIKVVCCEVSFAISQDGDLYSWGPSLLLGYPVLNESPFVPLPTKIVFPSFSPVFIVSVSCSLHHCSAITKDGQVYMWGKNGYGRLGLGKEEEEIDIIIPTLIPLFNNIKSSSCGINHTLFLDYNGNVYSCGSGLSTGFDLDDHENQPSFINHPKQIIILNEIKEISTGYYHNIILDNYGKVYVFGENRFGQFGNGQIDEGSYLPTTIEEILDIFAVSVCAGAGHNAVVSNYGQLYLFGGALVENESPTFRMTVALGGSNKQGGFSTAQFPLEQNQTTKLSNGEILEPTSFIQNSTEVEMDDEERFKIDCLLSEQDHILESIDNLLPQRINDRLLDNIHLISCGQYHTLAFNDIFKPKRIISLVDKCINHLARDIEKFEIDLKQSIHFGLICKIKSEMQLSRLHDRNSRKLFSNILKDYENKDENNNWNQLVNAKDMECEIEIIINLLDKNNIENIKSIKINNIQDYIILKNENQNIISMTKNKKICLIGKTTTMIICVLSTLPISLSIKHFDEMIQYFISSGY